MKGIIGEISVFLHIDFIFLFLLMNMDNQNNERDGVPQGNSQKFSGKAFWEKLRASALYTKKLFRIQEDTDAEATMASIQRSVEFKGINLWLLGFAVIIASVGLNVNSTAVIIGAMLISPLMGPINGVGLAVGIYDMELLRKSVRNLLVMVVISLLASTLYFLLSPLGDAQSELLARTRPTIYDVLIATFGGLAGIVAASRKDLPFTVVSGVAIATALMPPLCTAGYGIATWQLSYAFGASYLFFINSFFIALATFVMVRYLHFPQHKFVDARREKIVKRVVIILAIMVMIPSLFTAVNVVRESVFNSQVNKFVTDLRDGQHLSSNQQVVNVEKVFDRSNPTVTLSIVGSEVTPVLADSLRSVMRHDYGLNTTELKIKQMGNVFNAEIQAGQLGQMIAERDRVIKEQDAQIATLSGDAESYKKLSQRIGERYPESIAAVSVSKMIDYQIDKNDDQTLTTVVVTWKEGANRSAVQTELKQQLLFMLDVDEVRILSAN